MRKSVLFWALLCLTVAIVTEGLSLVGIALSGPVFGEKIRRTDEILKEQTRRIQRLIDPDARTLLVFDSILGWRYRSDYREGEHVINAQGIRSLREYTSVPPPGTLRVSAFGNSFVYCNEVGNEDSWPALIEAMFPDVEVLNYGVGGFGTDQAYLRFLTEGPAMSPDLVIMGFAPVDLQRVVNVYRRFISTREFPLVKPRFALDESGGLLLVPSPLRAPTDYEPYLREPASITGLGKLDYWYNSTIYEDPFYNLSATVRFISNVWTRFDRKYLDANRIIADGVFNRDSEAFAIQTALFAQFDQDVRATGILPLIVIFPDRDSITQRFRGQERVFDPLVEYLEADDLDYVDLTNAFLEAGTVQDMDSWFMPGGHYSPAGNGIVARWLGREIRARLTQTDSQ